MKTKIYYKKLLGIFILYSICYLLLFLLMFFDHYNTSQNITLLPIIGWLITTGYLLTFIKFKNE